jgi:hypothetical protein
MVLLTVALTFALSSCTVPPPRLMTFAEYRQASHDIPYIIEGSLD